MKPDLERLDEEIADGLSEIRSHLESAAVAAWRVGKALRKRKRGLEHGAWLPYLESLGLPARTAQAYMAIATKYATPAHLHDTLSACLKLEPRPALDVMCDTYPGLRERMIADDACRQVAEALAEIHEWAFDGKGEFPGEERIAWALGAERCLETEFGMAA